MQIPYMHNAQYTSTTWQALMHYLRNYNYRLNRQHYPPNYAQMYLQTGPLKLNDPGKTFSVRHFFPKVGPG